MYGGQRIHYRISAGSEKIGMQTKLILLSARLRCWLSAILALMPTGKSLITFKPRNPFEAWPFIYKSCIISFFINFIIACLNINTNLVSAGTNMPQSKFHRWEEWKTKWLRELNKINKVFTTRSKKTKSRDVPLGIFCIYGSRSKRLRHRLDFCFLPGGQRFGCSRQRRGHHGQ